MDKGIMVADSFRSEQECCAELALKCPTEGMREQTVWTRNPVCLLVFSCHNANTASSGVSRSQLRCQQEPDQVSAGCQLGCQRVPAGASTGVVHVILP
ncbi:hypothetical protein TNCV_4126351 [Trichonephila clavipes]|nr:hypothetical protein TNCV_4126351 [Trichonephila clavipes]